MQLDNSFYQALLKKQPWAFKRQTPGLKLVICSKFLVSMPSVGCHRTDHLHFTFTFSLTTECCKVQLLMKESAYLCLTLTDPHPSCASGIIIRGRSWNESTAVGLYTNSGRTPVAGRLTRFVWAFETQPQSGYKPKSQSA